MMSPKNLRFITRPHHLPLLPLLPFDNLMFAGKIIVTRVTMMMMIEDRLSIHLSIIFSHLLFEYFFHLADFSETCKKTVPNFDVDF